MSETLFEAEISKLKKEKLECNECLEDLRRKFNENDWKIKNCEEKKNEIAYKIGSLQQIKEQLAKQSNDVLKCESGIKLLKQLTEFRKQEKQTTAKISELKTKFCDVKEEAKFYSKQANEVKKLIKHMKLANQKLWERIDRLCEQYEHFESKGVIDATAEISPPQRKRLKTTEIELVIDDKPVDDKSSKSLHPLSNESNDEHLKIDAQESVCEFFGNNAINEKSGNGSLTDDHNALIDINEQPSKKESISNENKVVVKWDVSRRDIAVVKLLKHHLYVGSSDGTLKRFNIETDTEIVDYDTKKLKEEGIVNSRVKSLFIRSDKEQLFAALDDGFLCCFNMNSGELISDSRLDSYVVSCAEAWGELVLGRSDRNITIVRYTPNFTHLRTLSVKPLFQMILAVQPLVTEQDIRHLVVLGKGCKPIVINALTGDVYMSISNQSIYSPALILLNGDILCAVFTQSPESLRNKDSLISFFDTKKNYERIKMEFTRGVVTAAKVHEDSIIIALLRFNFTRILCYNLDRWKHLWTTFIGYEKVFALDYSDAGIFFGCRNGCVHRIQVNTKAVTCCDDSRCSCGQPFALLSDLRNIQFH